MKTHQRSYTDLLADRARLRAELARVEHDLQRQHSEWSTQRQREIAEWCAKKDAESVRLS